ARALQRCNDVRASFIASVHGSVGGMLLQLAPIRFPHVDMEADLRHVIGEKLLDLRFIPGDAGDGNHLLQKSDCFFTAVVDLLHKRLADTRTHLTSPKNPSQSVIKRRFHLSQSASADVAAARPPSRRRYFTLGSRRRAGAIAQAEFSRSLRDGP